MCPHPGDATIGGMSTDHQITEAELAELVERMDQAADAYIRGDIHRYLSLFDHASDYTLMSPAGGKTTEAGGLPDQDLSLRITVVFRRIGDRWAIVHRHADPLVHPIPLEHLAQLARGLDTSDPMSA